MNVKYANKVVVVKAYEVPAGEFNHQVKPIQFKAGQVLWKYNGKYNKRPAELSAKGLRAFEIAFRKFKETDGFNNFHDAPPFWASAQATPDAFAAFPAAVRALASVENC